MILYTDGVVEAESTGGTQYGVDNLIKLLDTQNLEESVRNGVGGAGVDPAQRIRDPRRCEALLQQSGAAG